MNDQNGKALTSIEELGEFGLIDHLAKFNTTKQANTVKSIGDDCAVIDNGDDYTLITTDILAEGVHFDLTYAPLVHLGYKSVAVNLSDIYAMNGTPRQITVSIALSSRFTLEVVEEIYRGIYLACNQYGVDLVGGDTTSSRAGMFISITAVGTVAKDKVVYRDKAKENDIICVTGDLGAAYMGLLVLEREKSVFKADPNMQPDLKGKDYILERQLKPEPRKDMVDLLAEKNIIPNAMIDVSDGLASDIRHIAKQSNLGCVIYEEKLPIFQQTYDTAREFSMDPTTAALNGGEDYELLFTVPAEMHEAFKEIPEINVIGYMSEAGSGYKLHSPSGAVTDMHAQGWDALKKEEE